MPKRRTDKRTASTALLFKAMGDQTRLALLQRLSDDGQASISALAQRFLMTRQGVTKHLHVLADAGVIEGSRRGRERVWAVNAARLLEGRRYLKRMARGWDASLDRLHAHVGDV